MNTYKCTRCFGIFEGIGIYSGWMDTFCPQCAYADQQKKQYEEQHRLNEERRREQEFHESSSSNDDWISRICDRDHPGYYHRRW